MDWLEYGAIHSSFDRNPFFTDVPVVFNNLIKLHFVSKCVGEWQIVFDIHKNIAETIVDDMMHRVKDKVDNDNEDIEENIAFGNEDEWTIVFVRCQMTFAKAKEWALLLFKWTELDTNGVPHSYIIMILKMKIKLFHLVIYYISCENSFRMVANIINFTYEVLYDPSLRFCTHHHVRSFIKVVCAINLNVFLTFYNICGTEFYYPPKHILSWLVYPCVHGKTSHYRQPTWMCTTTVPAAHGWSHVWNGL